MCEAIVVQQDDILNAGIHVLQIDTIDNAVVVTRNVPTKMLHHIDHLGTFNKGERDEVDAIETPEVLILRTRLLARWEVQCNGSGPTSNIISMRILIIRVVALTKVGNKVILLAI